MRDALLRFKPPGTVGAGAAWAAWVWAGCGCAAGGCCDRAEPAARAITHEAIDRARKRFVILLILLILLSLGLGGIRLVRIRLIRIRLIRINDAAFFFC